MSTAAWVIFAAHLPILAWLVRNRFRTWDGAADFVEARFMPTWAQWSTQGDRVTWVQHGAVALVASLYGGLLSFLAPESFGFGAALVGWIAWACYVVRESITARERWGKPNMWRNPVPHRAGWAVDGIMDTVGPLLVALAWTAL